MGQRKSCSIDRETCIDCNSWTITHILYSYTDHVASSTRYTSRLCKCALLTDSPSIDLRSPSLRSSSWSAQICTKSFAYINRSHKHGLPQLCKQHYLRWRTTGQLLWKIQHGRVQQQCTEQALDGATAPCRSPVWQRSPAEPASAPAQHSPG